MSKTLTSVGRNCATAAQGAQSCDVDQLASHWIRAMRRLPEARSRLFCFPHAGGSAATFRHWTSFFQPTIEVCVVHRSGCGDHLRDVPLTRIGPAVEAVCAALAQWSDKPFAFFGHSIGALIAFEVARRLAVLGGPAPSHLFVSACRAPACQTPGLHGTS
jgi:medium-chain acyl-[acyl-carrier-protein] hydrolase